MHPSHATCAWSWLIFPELERLRIFPVELKPSFCSSIRARAVPKFSDLSLNIPKLVLAQCRFRYCLVFSCVSYQLIRSNLSSWRFFFFKFNVWKYMECPILGVIFVPQSDGVLKGSQCFKEDLRKILYRTHYQPYMINILVDPLISPRIAPKERTMWPVTITLGKGAPK